MSTNLLGAKLHFKKLYETDNPFIDRFGTNTQKEVWINGGNAMIECKTDNELKQITELLGKIRDEVHSSNEHDVNYRLFYLKHGPQTYDEIKRALGWEIADAVKKLREEEN